MSHYGPERWVDFVRRVLPECERSAMLRHIDEGCEPCRREVELLLAVHTFSRQQREAEPPVDVVRLAQAIYTPPPRREGALRRLVGRLVFDSFAQPAVAGVRQVGSAGQQMAFEAGQYHIDLRLHGEMDSSRIALAGQIVSREAPQGGLGASSIELLAGRKVVAEAASNEFGEFCLEF